jgi:hypothetical protein
MGNPKSRQFIKQQESIRAWETARTSERHFSEDVSAPGIGARKIQVILVPAFEPGFAWDVRLLAPTWRLFRSSVVTSPRSDHLVGYEELDAPSDLLQSHFERLRGISVPLAPPLPDAAGADGTTYHLALFGGLSSELRIQWWSEYPDSWSPAVAIANEMIQEFLTYEPKVI